MSEEKKISVVEKFWKYPQDILDGKVVAPERIKRQAQRIINLKNDPDVYFDEKAVESFVTTSEKFIINDGHTLTGKNVEIYPFQLWLIGSLIGFRWKVDDGVVFKQTWVEVARGAGKSSLCALLAIWFATYYDAGDISILSGKADQAAIILDAIKVFLERTPNHGIEFDIKKTEVTIKNTVIKALSAKVHTLDGLKSRIYLVDEGHEFRDRIFEKVISALPKSRDSQMISVSTAGGNDLGRESVYYTNRVVAEECLKDFTKLRSVGAFLWGIDEWDQIDDEKCWIKGQPALGNIITVEDYRRAFETYKAQNREGDWERYQVCRYSLRQAGWIQMETIEEASADLDIMDFKGQVAYVGLDLSKSFDLSSMCVQFWKDQKCHAFWYHWVPSVGAREHYRAHASLIPEWSRKDFVEIVETQTIDYDKILDRLLWIRENFKLEKDSIGIDALAGFKPTLSIWENDHKLPLVGVPQTITIMGPATFTFESLIREKRITMRRDPVLEHSIGNVQLVTSHNGDRRVTKEKSTGVIDPVVAGIMSTAVAIEKGALKPPAYRTETDIVI